MTLTRRKSDRKTDFTFFFLFKMWFQGLLQWEHHTWCRVWMKVAPHLINQQHEDEADDESYADDGMLLCHIVMFVTVFVDMLMICAHPCIPYSNRCSFHSLLCHLHWCFFLSMVVMPWRKSAVFIHYLTFFLPPSPPGVTSTTTCKFLMDNFKESQFSQAMGAAGYHRSSCYISISQSEVLAVSCQCNHRNQQNRTTIHTSFNLIG